MPTRIALHSDQTWRRKYCSTRSMISRRRAGASLVNPLSNRNVSTVSCGTDRPSLVRRSSARRDSDISAPSARKQQWNGKSSSIISAKHWTRRSRARNRRAWTSSPTSWTWLASRLFKRPEATWSLCQPSGRSASDHDAALVHGCAQGQLARVTRCTQLARAQPGSLMPGCLRGEWEACAPVDRWRGTPHSQSPPGCRRCRACRSL